MLNPCQTKKFYDTEFEAEVYASKTEAYSGHEMIPYQCGTHWHITHADRKLRRGVGHKFWRCPKCKQVEKRESAPKHEC